MCFVWTSEQTAIISLYDINRLICITETECVYCAVRTEFSNIHVKLSVHMASIIDKISSNSKHSSFAIVKRLGPKASVKFLSL